MKIASVASAALVAGTLISLAVPAAAQTGPWTDGELLVRSNPPPSGAECISRVVPETGAAAVLTTVQYWGGANDSMAFDSYRGGVLANVSMPPDNTFLYRLWLISHDGSAAALPGFSGSLRALACTGDGRIFFIRHTSFAQGPKDVEYFDANNVIHTLKQTDGVTPFQIEVDRLLYHPASNALIGTSTGWASATSCTPGLASLYRIPLAANGLSVSGPVTCTSVGAPFNLGGGACGLDLMPDGNVLVINDSTNFPYVNMMLSVNPFTLAYSAWADPDQGILKGGTWSSRLGKAVCHAESGAAWWEPTGLRTFSAGQSGFGTFLPANMTMGVTSDVIDVDLNGPTCDGFSIPYGAGLVGNSGVIPLIGAIGCPDIGSTFTLSINGVVGGTNGMLFAGIAPGSTPLMGGTFLISGPVLVAIPIGVGGTPGVANAGSLAFPVTFVDPILAGVDIYMQAAFVDVAAIQGVSLTNGLRLQAN